MTKKEYIKKLSSLIEKLDKEYKETSPTNDLELMRILSTQSGLFRAKILAYELDED